MKKLFYFLVIFYVCETKNDSLPESFNLLNSKIQEWNESNLDPIFLGLKDNYQYNKLNPDRFK